MCHECARKPLNMGTLKSMHKDTASQETLSRKVVDTNFVYSAWFVVRSKGIIIPHKVMQWGQCFRIFGIHLEIAQTPFERFLEDKERNLLGCCSSYGFQHQVAPGGVMMMLAFVKLSSVVLIFRSLGCCWSCLLTIGPTDDGEGDGW